MNAVATRRQLISTFLTCILLGPPVGGFVNAAAFYYLPSDPMVSPSGALESFLTTVTLAIVGIPFSYLFGGFSALLSGIAMTVYGRARGRPPLWFALIVAAIVFAILQSFQTDQSREAAVVLLAMHLIPAAVCWFVLQRFWALQK